MLKLSEAILHHARNQPEGAPLSSKKLLHLGRRAAIDQALSRLTRSDELMCAGRSLYVLPLKSRFGTQAPLIRKTVEVLATQHGERTASRCAIAVYALGLTTQVPIRPLFPTSG